MASTYVSDMRAHQGITYLTLWVLLPATEIRRSAADVVEPVHVRVHNNGVHTRPRS